MKPTVAGSASRRQWDEGIKGQRPKSVESCFGQREGGRSDAGNFYLACEYFGFDAPGSQAIESKGGHWNGIFLGIIFDRCNGMTVKRLKMFQVMFSFDGSGKVGSGSSGWDYGLRTYPPTPTGFHGKPAEPQEVHGPGHTGPRDPGAGKFK